MSDVSSYIGRQEVVRDYCDSQRMARLAATLDHDVPPWEEGVLPPLGHWLCFTPSARQSQIGDDGHPVRTDTGLLPNIDLPRRMWAGSRIRFLADIPLDTSIVRTSTLIAATHKSGRSGNMLLATVSHEIAVEGQPVAIEEEQDIVYREAAKASVPFVRNAVDPGEDYPVLRDVTADTALLFRYSALTFNAHRIHYDRDYARGEENYPGLVVQGPLIATLMLDHLLREKMGKVRFYNFRAMSPLFDGETIKLGLNCNGKEIGLRATGPAGIAMAGAAGLA